MYEIHINRYIGDNYIILITLIITRIMEKTLLADKHHSYCNALLFL